MSGLPEFAEVYGAVYGRRPFPWQARLATQVLECGWPDLLDLPTGSGKTTALDIALYTLAAAPDRMPRRMVLVVDRRIVVDQAAAHARALLQALQSAAEGPLRSWAAALRRLWDARDDDPPFGVAVLRGGMPRDNDWARSADQPLVASSTVDQVGSRLLFRGYGVSPRSAPLHAGLIGNDTLLLLDEVHLAEPFAQTLGAVASRYRTASGLPGRFAVVRMSATPHDGGTSPRRFGLSAEDREHPELQRRLAASKIATLREVPVRGNDEAANLQLLARHAADAALDHAARGARRIGIVLNRVDAARRARALLHEAAGDPDVLLLTGRMRPLERDALVERDLLPRVGPGAPPDSDRPLFVVATQCIEAGADLDFDALVSECASLDALCQRFGRLDRRGRLGESAATILCRSDAAGEGAEDPVYGTALGATWAFLLAAGGRRSERKVDMGIDARPDAGPAATALVAPRVTAPVLLPAHLDAWSQTAPPADFAPDVAPFLHGPQRGAADVSIVFRADLDAPPQGDGDPGGVRLAQAVRRLSLVRPSSLEAFPVPIGAARAWLAGRAAPPVSDTESLADADPRDARDGMPVEGASVSRLALRWRAEDSAWVGPEDLRPGDVLVVPATYGGIAHGSFDPEATSPVTDLAEFAAFRARGRALLRLDEDVLAGWSLPEDIVAAMPAPAADEPVAAFRERLRDWLDGWPEEPPGRMPVVRDAWAAFRRDLRSSRARLVRLDDGAVVVSPALPERARRAEVADAVTEDDESSFSESAIGLDRHLRDVAAQARRTAERLGLPPALVDDVQRAARLHDAGKADERFQRLLVGGSEVRLALLREPIAKSPRPPGHADEVRLAAERSGYPPGYRHELLSTALAESGGALEGAHDPDLVRHLIASHHGYARPFVPFVDDGSEHEVEVVLDGRTLRASTRHGLARLDSTAAARFWRLQERYGWWGLAWLEALVRLADHRVSRDLDGETTP